MCQYCDDADEQAEETRRDEFYSNLVNSSRHQIETHTTVTHITDLEFTGKLPSGATIKGTMNGSLLMENHISIYRFGDERFFWTGHNVVDKIVGTIRGEFVPDESGACLYIMMNKEPDCGNVD